MLLLVRFDLDAARMWHLRLLERLSQRQDMAVVVEPTSGPRVAANVERLLRLEPLMHRGSQAVLAARVPRAAFEPWTRKNAAAPDLVLDLCGGPAGGDRPIWHLEFDGGVGEPALLEAIMHRRAPVAVIRQGERIIATGRLGTESQGIVLGTFEDALARTLTLIVGAFSGAATAVPVLAEPKTRWVAAPLSTIDLGTIVGKLMARRAAQIVHRRLFQSPHWRVGWRKVDGPDVYDLQRHPDSGWRDLPDDGLRFYADPFPFIHEGQLTLFVEEYPHETGRGIISAVPFGPHGPLGRPVPVLELPYHLSYPFVFARDGEVWMIPESCAAGTIDLFRATRYPGGWVKDRTLIDGVTASDATLFEDAGRWWMFATEKDGGSYSDALYLWSAPDFRGPWTPHAGNPVLIDSAGARPAGRVVVRDGVIRRPVQDCRASYGAALGLARITQLDDSGFRQEVDTILTAGPAWPGRWLHTLNRAGDFEFIDGSSRARKSWLPRRGPVSA